MTGNPHPKDLSKSPSVAGFFVCGHLGLVGCNIALMKYYLKLSNIIIVLLFICWELNAQMALPTFQAFSMTHFTFSGTFTNCGATERYGPTQSQVNSTYTSGNSLYNAVTINTQGIQEWTVPVTGTYKISVWGAQGGPMNGYADDVTSRGGLGVLF